MKKNKGYLILSFCIALLLAFSIGGIIDTYDTVAA